MPSSSKGRSETLAAVVFAGVFVIASCAAPPAEDSEPSDGQRASANLSEERDAVRSVDGAGQPSPSAACADCCPDGFPRGAPSPALQRLAAFTPSPADVAVCPNGDVFLTLDGQDQVWRVPVGADAGAPEHYADVTGVQPAGIACDERGRLYVAAFALRKGSSYGTPGILLVEGSRTPPRLLPKIAGTGWLTPNGVAAAAGIGIYVSDTLAGNIVLVREKDGKFESTIVARNMTGVNGLGYDGAARKLYASNSLNQAVLSFVVDRDGALSQKTRLWSGPLGAMLDEVEVDERGQVYVAAYGLGRVYRLPGESIVAKVTNPASLAFRGGKLLVVDYHLNEPKLEGGLYAADLGVCGAP